jgi:hypothetical protein
VVSFEDELMDLQAEIDGMETKMQNFDCKLPFKSFATEEYCKFNSR